MTGVALPNAHATGDWRVLQCFCKRGFHILPAQKKHYFTVFVKEFLKLKKIRTSPYLWAEKMVVD